MRFHRSRMDRLEHKIKLPDHDDDLTPLIERANCLVYGISDPLPDDFRPVYRPEDSYHTKLQSFFDAVKNWRRSLGEDVSYLDGMVVMKTEYAEGETIQDRIDKANRLIEGIGQEQTRPKQQTAEKPTLRVVT
jgi:hypothetical protein